MRATGCGQSLDTLPSPDARKGRGCGVREHSRFTVVSFLLLCFDVSIIQIIFALVPLVLYKEYETKKIFHSKKGEER